MRYLIEEELEIANHIMGIAAKEALKSTCQKSKRGAIIVRENKIISAGRNDPPLDTRCVPEFCMKICRDYTIHAEQNAILNALAIGQVLRGSRMYHEKIKSGNVEVVPKPDEKSYLQCSKLILHTGIEEYVLRHKDGIAVYSAREFYDFTLRTALI